MPVTDFEDILNDPESASTPARDQVVRSSGTPVSAAEIEAALSPSLYAQLENGEEASVVRASERATMHVSAILGRLGSALSLDNPVSRQIVISWTIYELFIALGNTKDGSEYKRKAKDLIIAVYGTYPDADDGQEGKPAIGAVTVPRPRLWP